MYGSKLTGYKSLSEAARELGVTKMGVVKMFRRGELSPEYIGNTYIIPDSELDRFVKDRRKAHIDDGRYKVK